MPPPSQRGVLAAREAPRVRGCCYPYLCRLAERGVRSRRMSFFARLAVSWAVNALALGVTGWLLHGVTFHHSAGTLIFAAAVFGVLNTVLKPVLKLLTLPLAVLTFGVAWFGVSMLMLWLTDVIVGKFDIQGFWNLVWATIIVWVVNLVLENVILRDRALA
jgi:putative membrane protein